MVFIPVRLVTVADPPRINMDETMIFVANLSSWLKPIPHDEIARIDLPEEHEYKMCDCPPTSTNNLQPSMSIGCVQLELGGELWAYHVDYMRMAE